MSRRTGPSTPSPSDLEHLMIRTAKSLALLVALLSAVPAQRHASAQNVTTFHNGADRAGAYVVPGLTYAAAAKLHLDANFKAAITGDVYAQPLYWKAAGARKGLVIVATEENLVYALDEATGAQVWKATLPRPAPHK